jgi:AcrR family transcriptional regulator
VRVAAGVSSSQVYHYSKDKKALVQAVIEYLDETIVGGQEPLLVTLDSREGPRAWRDFLVKHVEEPGCRGLPQRVAGSELAETHADAARKAAARTWLRPAVQAARPCRPGRLA